MSNIIATISDIKNCDSLHIVEFIFHSQTLSMMSLELNENIKIGTKVKLAIKSSHISLAKNFNGDVSFENKLPTKVISIENGELLSSVTLSVFDTTLEAITTRKSIENMDLKVEDNITAFIQMSELSIVEIVND
ncbi:MAG TPA: transporter [Arcobacter sp.]|nr:transporter [Arcobacter sp.]